MGIRLIMLILLTLLEKICCVCVLVLEKFIVDQTWPLDHTITRIFLNTSSLVIWV